VWQKTPKHPNGVVSNFGQFNHQSIQKIWIKWEKFASSHPALLWAIKIMMYYVLEQQILQKTQTLLLNNLLTHRKIRLFLSSTREKKINVFLLQNYLAK